MKLPSSLEKIYEILEVVAAEKHEMVRVIDERTRTIFYPAAWIVPIELPTNAEHAILSLVEH